MSSRVRVSPCTLRPNSLLCPRGGCPRGGWRSPPRWRWRTSGSGAGGRGRGGRARLAPGPRPDGAPFPHWRDPAAGGEGSTIIGRHGKSRERRARRRRRPRGCHRPTADALSLLPTYRVEKRNEPREMRFALLVGLSGSEKPTTVKRRRTICGKDGGTHTNPEKKEDFIKKPPITNSRNELQFKSPLRFPPRRLPPPPCSCRPCSNPRPLLPDHLLPRDPLAPGRRRPRLRPLAAAAAADARTDGEGEFPSAAAAAAASENNRGGGRSFLLCRAPALAMEEEKEPSSSLARCSP